jgi:GT2 family glycosyltransferase
LSKDSYNLITDCIKSIEQHVKYPNTKIYIFDTGTSDRLVLEYYKQILNKCKFPIEIINVGSYNFSKNYNFGLKLVNTDYYLIQNNDTVALNDYVSKLMKICILDKIGACGPRMLYKNGNIQHDGQILYDHGKKAFTSPTHVNLGRTPVGIKTGKTAVDGITCAGMLIKSSRFWEVGGLPEIYHDIFQDVELNIKIRMGGYSIYCDRDAVIHHYDNTSRNLEYENTEKLKLKHFDYDLLYRRHNRELKYIEREKYKFSIVTLVNNEDQYNEFLNNIKEQDCNFNFEIIALPNFNNEYKSCAEALNIGIDLSESEYVMMCHQDIRFDKNWFSNIICSIKDLVLNNIKFGVLGMAGSWYHNNNEGGVIFLNNNTESKNDTRKYVDVQCLDELCLIIKNDSYIRFDETLFNHYHFYGADLCLNYISNGYRNLAINVPCTHLSDGFGNLTNISNLEKYIQCSYNLMNKWSKQFKQFRNQTAKFNSSESIIYYYVAEELNKRGISMKNSIFVN